MDKEIKNIVLLGPQGSGKSTQGELIANYLGSKLASSGDVLRKVIAEKTELGQKIAEFVNEGVLVPDQYMIALFQTTLSQSAYQNGFILDGFPRNINQAHELDEHYEVSKVFNIEISDKVAIARISGRRICDQGHVFHMEHKPPKKEGVCDICQATLHARSDDTPDLIAKRLFIYRQETAPLLKYYGGQDKLVTFDGEQNINKVGQDIIDYLKKNV